MHRRITGKLVIATHNPGKLAEMRELLAPYGIEAVSAGELGLAEPEETGDSFRANAQIKAAAAAKASRLPAFADDSGLVVDALDGAPGIYSARWAGPTASDQDNLDLLLRQLADVEAERRTAAFVCAMALVWSDGEATRRGEVSGRLTDAPRGQNGFGYDPLFIPDGKTLTTAELDPSAKDEISHRGRAVRAIVEVLAELMSAAERGDR